MLRHHADFPYLKSGNGFTLPLPSGLVSAGIRQVFWLAIHPPGVFPTFRSVTSLPFVLAYSGGSAGDSFQWNCTPLPYQALAGTVIRYSASALFRQNMFFRFRLLQSRVQMPRLAVTVK